MARISREQLFMDICDVIARRSTCGRNNVGCIIVENHNIVAMGYNGPVAGAPHCTGVSCERTESGGCKRSIHAEQNALSRCPPTKTLKDLYTSFSPCLPCAQRISALGSIKRVFYRTDYRLRDGIEYLVKEGIPVYRITHAGYIVNAQTNEPAIEP